MCSGCCNMHIPMPPRTSHRFRDSNKPNLFRKINRKENVPKSVPKGIKIDEERCGKRVKGDGQLASSIINPTGRREELCIPHHRWRSVCRKKAKMNEEGADDGVRQWMSGVRSGPFRLEEEQAESRYFMCQHNSLFSGNSLIVKIIYLRMRMCVQQWAFSFWRFVLYAPLVFPHLRVDMPCVSTCWHWQFDLSKRLYLAQRLLLIAGAWIE